MKIINLKIKAGEGEEIEWDLPKEEKGNAGGKVVDLMPLLRKSLEERKKAKAPAARAKKASSHKKVTRKKAG
jgi:non-homologous end joining protein Ku